MSKGKLLIGLTFQPSFIKEEQREQRDGGCQTSRSALTFCHFPPLPLLFCEVGGVGVEGGREGEELEEGQKK